MFLEPWIARPAASRITTGTRRLRNVVRNEAATSLRPPHTSLHLAKLAKLAKLSDMVSQPSSYLLVISDRQALAWIISSQRMAFPGRRSASVSCLRANDNLLLYTTRGCFRHPSRDRGRVIAYATVDSEVSVLDMPVEFNGRIFPVGCSLHIQTLTPYGAGVELAEYASRMHIFRNPKSWGIYIRRTLVAIDNHDYCLLQQALGEVAVEPTKVITEYVV
jgi:hypothetical protein